MQVGLCTRIDHDLRIRLDALVKEDGRPLAQVVAEAIEEYLQEKERAK